MTTPIESLLSGMEWTEVTPKPEPEGNMPYATHSGLLDIHGLQLRCYRLSTGQAVIDADDMRAFFGSDFL